jgi:hypothetical protein
MHNTPIRMLGLSIPDPVAFHRMSVHAKAALSLNRRRPFEALPISFDGMHNTPIRMPGHTGDYAS